MIMDLTKLIFNKEQFRSVLANVTDCFNDAYRYNYGFEGDCAGSCEGCCADTRINDFYAGYTGNGIEQSNDSAED